MKYAIVFSALAAVALAAKPSFLNSNFDVKEGESFTLKFNNCQSGCTITIQSGPQTNTKDVKTLTTSATGDSFTFTPSDLGSGTYNFKITSNTDKTEFNYSKQFTYSGTGTTGASTTGASSTVSASASSTGTASTTASSTESESSTSSGSTTATTATSSSSASSASTTSAPSTTTSTRSTSTRSTTAATTTVPNAGARATPFALVAGAVAAFAYL